MTAFLIAHLIGCFSYRKKLLKNDDKIKLKDSGITYLLIWSVISLCNIPVILHQFPDSAVDILFWVILNIYILMIVFSNKYCYITDDEIIRNDILTGHALKKEKIRYKIDEDTLLLYYGKRVNPMKFRIIEQMDKLAAILAENYRQYESKEEQT